MKYNTLSYVPDVTVHYRKGKKCQQNYIEFTDAFYSRGDNFSIFQEYIGCHLLYNKWLFNTNFSPQNMGSFILHYIC